MGEAAIDTLSSPTPAPHYRTNGGRIPYGCPFWTDRCKDEKVVSKYAHLRHLVDTYLGAHKYNSRIRGNIFWWLLYLWDFSHLHYSLWHIFRDKQKPPFYILTCLVFLVGCWIISATSMAAHCTECAWSNRSWSKVTRKSPSEGAVFLKNQPPLYPPNQKKRDKFAPKVSRKWIYNKRPRMRARAERSAPSVL